MSKEICNHREYGGIFIVLLLMLPEMVTLFVLLLVTMLIPNFPGMDKSIDIIDSDGAGNDN